MVAAFDYCLHGRGGAAPSIDTAMHGLVDAAHVDHLHPDSGIAFATAADGEALTRRCFGDRVVWVPWRRPGFQLGLDIAAIRARPTPGDRRILGGHGITAWGDTSEECEANSLEIIRTAEPFIAEHGPAEPFGAGRPGLRAAARRRAPRPRRRAAARSSAASPRRTGRRSATSPTPTVVLDFLSRDRAPAAGRARHVVPGPLPAHQGPAAGPRPAADRAARGRHRPARASCTRPTATTTAAYYERHADARQPGDARRRPGDRAGARRRHVLASARTSRPPGSPASSTSTRST